MTKPQDVNAANLWLILRDGAERRVKNDALMAGVFEVNILDHKNFGNALAFVLASKLAPTGMASAPSSEALFAVFKELYAGHSEFIRAAKRDLLAIAERDPAVTDFCTPFLFFKGYHALQTHRLAHALWGAERRDTARFLQSQLSILFGVDIHPAARLGRGLMLDHATGVVIGETAVIEDDVSILHGVTLGGTGKEDGDRHPKIRRGVLIGANATILGNIEIGECSRIAAGSVVLRSVPPRVTVAGVPARVVGKAGCPKPGTVMDQIPKFPQKEDGKLEENCDFPF